jgi:uncharacterized membrane protein YbhN (UPF0104 family)
MGIWQIAEGVIKGVSGARVGKAVADIVWGCGGIALAYLLKGYGAGTVDAANIGSYLVILFGVSVIASGLIGSFFYDN